MSAPAQIERAAAQLQQIAANKELSAAQRQAAAALAAQASGTLSHAGFGGAEIVQDSGEDHEHYGTVSGAVSSPGVEPVLLGAADTVIWSAQLLSPVPSLRQQAWRQTTSLLQSSWTGTLTSSHDMKLVDRMEHAVVAAKLCNTTHIRLLENSPCDRRRKDKSHGVCLQIAPGIRQWRRRRYPRRLRQPPVSARPWD